MTYLMEAQMQTKATAGVVDTLLSGKQYGYDQSIVLRIRYSLMISRVGLQCVFHQIQLQSLRMLLQCLMEHT
jgi:hypothetical protein